MIDERPMAKTTRNSQFGDRQAVKKVMGLPIFVA
jgi:hypothetical protein